MATASVSDVAHAIRQRLPGVPTVKLHKLLYFAQGFHLAQVGEPLFHDVIEAWKYGPVVAEFWRADRYVSDREPAALDNDQLNTIGYVCSRYGNNSGGDLMSITHDQPPWRDAFWRRVGWGEQHTIEVDTIRQYFLDVLKADADDREIEVDQDQLAGLLTKAREHMNQRDAPGPVDTAASLLARLRG